MATRNTSWFESTTRWLAAGCVALGAFGVIAEDAAAQAIQLRDGKVLVGEVLDATSDGLSFRRLDNGGLLELDWADLSTLHAERLKRLEGIVVEEEGEVTVLADEIVYAIAGGTRVEIIGLVLDRKDGFLQVKQKSGILPVKQADVKNVRKIEVPVFEIYTKGEYYQIKLDEIQPGDDADKHIQLAEALRRVGLYDQAEQHLVRADELGGGKQKSQLEGMLARIRLLQEAAEERGLLSQISVMRNRKEWTKGRELVAEFRQRFADSKLMKELERAEQKLESARERNLVDQVRQDWDRTVSRVAEDQAKEDDFSLTQARTYAEDRMAQDVFAKIGDLLDIEAEEVENLWRQRLEAGHVRATLYSYGIGSWLLGDDAVLKDTAHGDAAGQTVGAGDSAQDRELERIMRKIREVQKRGRQLAQSGGPGGAGSGEVSEEDWWRDASRQERTSWLRSYFAEYGGQMEVVRAFASECATCDGLGHLVQLGQSGREEKLRCPLCHGTRFTRVIRAR